MAPQAHAMPDPADRIAAWRAFNRFYTRRIGVLHEGLLDSKFSLAESRLLWELAHCDHTTATELARTLDLDAGYLSRLLRGFKARGLVKAGRSLGDARQTRLSITAAGRRAFAPLDRRSQTEVAALLGPLSDAQQQELLVAMARIESLLGTRARNQPFVLRAHRPGDIGWVVSRHGALYAQEYGWDLRFEALAARAASRQVV
jgi:DNA-binding MarR family transcriptional regulator